MTAPAVPTGLDTPALAALAERIAREAGALVQGQRPAVLEVADTKTSPTDVVTEMDRAAENLVLAALAAARPQDAVVGEEYGNRAGASGLTWVVDPIDGTVNYLYGIPAYAVSVAVVVGDPQVPGAWYPVAGCVHNPASGETWTAAAGHGAFLDGRRLSVAAPVELAGALVATGFGYMAARRLVQARVLGTLLPRVRDIRRIGSAALDLCMVASGRADAYFERGLHAWDMAAAVLVVLEAGATVAGMDGLPPHEHMVVAAAEPLCSTLVGELEALGAGNDV